MTLKKILQNQQNDNYELTQTVMIYAQDLYPTRAQTRQNPSTEKGK